ncbi:hypothetical protein V8F06_004374 [Rhypophila decipiens]
MGQTQTNKKLPWVRGRWAPGLAKPKSAGKNYTLWTCSIKLRFGVDQTRLSLAEERTNIHQHYAEKAPTRCRAHDSLQIRISLLPFFHQNLNRDRRCPSSAVPGLWRVGLFCPVITWARFRPRCASFNSRLLLANRSITPRLCESLDDHHGLVRTLNLDIFLRDNLYKILKCFSSRRARMEHINMLILQALLDLLFLQDTYLYYLPCLSLRRSCHRLTGGFPSFHQPSRTISHSSVFLKKNNLFSSPGCPTRFMSYRRMKTSLPTHLHGRSRGAWLVVLLPVHVPFP